jgi:hypothetical protein
VVENTQLPGLLKLKIIKYDCSRVGKFSAVAGPASALFLTSISFKQTLADKEDCHSFSIQVICYVSTNKPYTGICDHSFAQPGI